jgi:hypothetical protein
LLAIVFVEITAQPAGGLVRVRPRGAERTAYKMRALGKRGLPASFTLGGVSYRLLRDVKHDFWAATGFYESDDGRRVVLKAGRAEDFAGAPLAWVGRWLRGREMRIYEKLKGLDRVPRLLGTVGETGFVLEFMPGRPLQRRDTVPDGFFAELRALVEEIHRRGIAYVDMNKRANILVGEDGRPYLVDFQISWDGRTLGDTWLNRRILRYLQREDLYHIRKHHARLRPDELTPDERAAAEQRSFLIRLHRLIAKPWYGFRRHTMKRMRESGRIMPEGSE